MTTIRLADPGAATGRVKEIFEDHYTTLDTLSEGLQIDSDIRPPT